MKRELLVGLAVSSVIAVSAGCWMFGATGQAGSAADTTHSRVHASAAHTPWTTTNRYPEWFRTTYRYKELVGGVSNWQSLAGDWKGIPHGEIRMGVLQLDRGAIYPFHSHPAPELYFVMKGIAEWTVGTETFTATTGTAIHTPPNIRHQMINTGPETLELLFVWWAPGGDNAVLDVPSKMLEDWDRPQAAKR